MPPSPDIRFFLARSDDAVTPNSAFWTRPIPLTRDSGHPPDPDGADEICYGDYFSAVHQFLIQDKYRHCLEAVQPYFEASITPDQLDHLSVFLVKHGEFYHPARVEIGAGCRSFEFVVNVAVSPAGLSVVHGEHGALRKLYREFDHKFLPRVFGLASVPIGEGWLASLFIGEWLSGFSEFHFTDTTSPGERKLSVWDPDGGDYCLSKSQGRQVFRRTAAILTYYYNVETFERVAAWHHAAGDFIVRRFGEKPDVDVRLITVRRYVPLLRGVEVNAESIVEALVIFFLDLSIRNRLDRLDGVGDMVWADSWVVRSTVEGFFEGLALKVIAGDIPEDFPEFVHRHLASYSPGELSELAGRMMVGRFPGESEEMVLISEQLSGHVDSLHRAVMRTDPTVRHL